MLRLLPLPRRRKRARRRSSNNSSLSGPRHLVSSLLPRSLSNRSKCRQSKSNRNMPSRSNQSARSKRKMWKFLPWKSRMTLVPHTTLTPSPMTSPERQSRMIATTCLISTAGSTRSKMTKTTCSQRKLYPTRSPQASAMRNYGRSSKSRSRPLIVAPRGISGMALVSKATTYAIPLDLPALRASRRFSTREVEVPTSSHQGPEATRRAPGASQCQSSSCCRSRKGCCRSRQARSSRENRGHCFITKQPRQQPPPRQRY